ncbi:MAG: hypothetical protein GY769_10725 [bacterium]|nr:hypothetical protein [bacterium]
MTEKPPVILVKLGGSLITDKAGQESVRTGVLARLAAELREVREVIAGGMVLGHGSGSFGHAVATSGGWSSPGVKPSLDTLVRTQDAAARLHRKVMAALLEAGLDPFSVAPGSSMVSSKGRLVSLSIEPLAGAIECGLLPVLFGDVVLDTEDRARIFSTERVFLAVTPLLMARGFRVSAAYWLGNTDGVLDSVGETIGLITRANADEVMDSLSETASSEVVKGPPGVSDVTGGMRHRVKSALALSRLGVPSWILDGRSEGLLLAAARGEEVSGTRVDPD